MPVASELQRFWDFGKAVLVPTVGMAVEGCVLDRRKKPQCSRRTEVVPIA